MKRLPVREQALIFRELATLVSAGIGISEALGSLQDRPLSHDLRRFLGLAQDRVGQGQRLSLVMDEHAPLFSELTVALVAAGEESGRLDHLLRQAALYLEQEVELRNMISRETFYPKLLIAAALLIPLAAQCIVAWLTQSLLAAVVALVRGLLVYAAIGLAPVLVLYFLYQSSSGTETGKTRIDAAKLGVPLIGPVVEQLSLAKFARALSSLYDAGVGFPRAIAMASDACGNRYIAGQISPAIVHFEKGGAMSEALMQTRFANSVLVRLLRTGEQTGNIDEMMSKAADHYEDEAQTQIRRLAVAIMPVVTIIMGIVVAVMVVRFYVGHYTDPF